MSTYLRSDQVTAALTLRDLSNPSEGPHAMQELLVAVVDALTANWGVPARRHRSSPIVPVEDNYDRLGFSSEAITRDSRYSRYLSPTVMLRSHTSAAIPWLLRTLEPTETLDELQVLPGLVYRRDSIDRTHVGEPHQVDLWRIASTPQLTFTDLETMLGVIADAVIPGAQWRAVPALHPYTADGSGRQLDVLIDDEWLELAECGLIEPDVLATAGLDPNHWSGLALGMGLDRALMLRKGIADIRVLRDSDPRIEQQMSHLNPWVPVSSLPAISRDLSIVINEKDDDETIGDRIRTAVADRLEDVETVSVIARTSYDALPEPARRRLGLEKHQVNALVRIVFRPLHRTLTDQETNSLRDRVYLAVHQGPHLELIA